MSKLLLPVCDGELHWIRNGDRTDVMRWNAGSQIWACTRWTIFYTPKEAARQGYTYWAPALPPEHPAVPEAQMDLAL